MNKQMNNCTGTRITVVLLVILFQHSNAFGNWQIGKKGTLITIQRCSTHVKSIVNEDTNIIGNNDFVPTETTHENRRQVLNRISQNVIISLGIATTTTFVVHHNEARAFDRTYPGELIEPENGSPMLDGRERKKEQIRQQEANRVSKLELGPGYKPLSSFLWGSALWFLSGSRSNPIVTPLANVLYDKDKEAWLKDRNDGMFADIPISLYAILALLFITTGFCWDSLLVSQFTEGDRNVSLQLAGVSLITGASLELGRIASGEKKLTRDEYNRYQQLESEFNEFANSRLIKKSGGNCHRSEIVKAFRRYYAKYRQPDNQEYPLGDLEIERLLREWSKQQQQQQQRGDINIAITSAGFYSGIQINTEADVFVQR